MEISEKDYISDDYMAQNSFLKVNHFQNRIAVFCRIRPIAERSSPLLYKIINQESTLELIQSIEVLNRLGAARYYRFTHVFDTNATQIKIFEEVCLPKLNELFKGGLNILIFTYGVTNAGKTYTMVGDDENPGILRRTLEWLFSLKDELNRQKNGEKSDIYPPFLEFFGFLNNDSLCPTHFVDLRVSLRCFEIYNDDVFDLFAPKNKRNKLKLKEGEDKRTLIDEIVTINIDNSASIKSSLHKCLTARSIKDTLLNHSSSRSHCIFRVIVQFIFDNESEETIFERTINIVDLAGAERAKRTENTGVRLKEANKINQSLSCLGRCLSALRDGTLPPYRETKLTKFLAEFFLEQNCIAMITNINPEENELEESVRVLNYAALARQVPLAKSRYEFRSSVASLSLKKPTDRAKGPVSSVEDDRTARAIATKLSNIESRFLVIEEKLNRILEDIGEIKAIKGNKLNENLTAKTSDDGIHSSPNFTNRDVKSRAEHLLRIFKKNYSNSVKKDCILTEQLNPPLFHKHSDYSGFSTKDLTIIIERKEIFEHKKRDQALQESKNFC